jgi:hypothetical protein
MVDVVSSAQRNTTQDIARQVTDALKPMVNCMADVAIARHTDMSHQVQNVPALTKGLIMDMVRQLEQQSEAIHTNIQQVVGSMYKPSTKAKGAEGEDRMYDILTDLLRTRDGYTVDRTHGQAFACDLLVTRTDHPDIRIEIKTHADKVRHKEVEKFIRDLQHTDCHGIFVSIHSGIVGVANLEIQHLPNNRFAIFLTNNDYDADAVVEVMHLIYRLDRLTDGVHDAKDERHVRVMTDVMARVQTYLKDYGVKIQMAKSHLKDTMTILNDMRWEAIHSLLTGVEQQATPPPISCKWCDKPFTTKVGCKNHERVCSAKSTPAT